MQSNQFFSRSAAIGIALLAIGGGRARADTGPTPSPSPSEVTKVPAVPGESPRESVDDVITNNNLRAYSGSKSEWSVASQFNYNGGSISAPFDQDRPNISGASGTTTKADLDGQISVKYNLDAKNSLLAGIGLRWIAPLSGGPSNYSGTTFDVMNPFIEYQRVYKWLGIQSVLQVEFMQWTQADQTALGYARQINVDQENLFEIGSTGLSIGASTSIQFQMFDKSGAVGTPGADDYLDDVTTAQSDYYFSVEPALEYQLSEKLNLRTVVGLWTFEHYRSSAKALDFTHDKIYQSVGLGISVTRDIFLYPNIQFLPGQLQAARTNLGLGATINVF